MWASSAELGMVRVVWPTGMMPLPRPRVDCARHARPRGAVRALPLTVCVGVTLMMVTNDACAAALGSLATSAGVCAALLALFVIKGWPAHLPASAMSSMGGALALAAGAAWLWRARPVLGLAGFSASPPDVGLGAAGSADRASKALAVPLPAGIDCAELLATLRQQFIALQRAWDQRDTDALRVLTTPEMLDELQADLQGSLASDAAACTEVVTLHAELLGFEVCADASVVSVHFTGLIRESVDTGAEPFRELWLLTQSKDEPSGWRLARHQALI